jgi:dienelactone hydrolase
MIPVLFLSAATLFGQLPATRPLEVSGDAAAQMVEGIHRYLDRATEQTGATRRPGSTDNLRRILGAVDPREPARLEWVATTEQPALVGDGAGFKAYAVRWAAMEGVFAEGLLLEPEGAPAARVIALPDADHMPEVAAGLVPGLPAALQHARRLAENRCQVLIPTLVDRAATWSGIPGIRMTNLPHREFLYRMAFEVGRHIIGYEVQKALAAVDWFEQQNRVRRVPILATGYGEGGLIALHAAALDARIARVLVSGSFQSRQQVWREPIYRDVWGLLKEFGDAEVAALIKPRLLIVDPAPMPAISGPPPETSDRKGAAPEGRIQTPPLQEVEDEIARARSRYQANVRLAAGHEALTALLGHSLKPDGGPPRHLRQAFDPASRLKRQFQELVDFTQLLVRRSPARRAEFWAAGSMESRKAYLWDEMIGRMPPPSLPSNPRSRQIYDTPKFRGYEVMLDVWPDVFAYGVLLLPKDIKPGERRPVVVCQHGLEGRPTDLADPALDHPAYHRYAVRLAEEGFVVFAPQNPYIGKDRFRLIQRKGHPLKLALFSFILGQHQRILEWLGAQPFVDPARIGFYGLSYGGKTAVRVPPLLDGYALSICSADFNEWVWKTTSVEARYSYLLTPEYDMAEFNLANLANYAELANLMAPRPFMVERGHDDGVAPDEWVAYEYAKVRRHYAKLGLADRTAIEFFNGPHTIHGVGTFEFLRRHLNFRRPTP